MAQIFPPWWNKLPIVAAIAGSTAPVLAIAVVWYFFSPWYTDVGYRPVQPVPYSHKLHVGELGLDCRYCHASVEISAVANVPPTRTCMNGHQFVTKDSKLPDYAYFAHNVHVAIPPADRRAIVASAPELERKRPARAAGAGID